MSTAVTRLQRNPKPKSALGPDDNGMIMTPEDFDAVTDWDRNHTFELVDGELVVSPASSPSEMGPNDYLGYLIQDFKWRHKKGMIVDLTHQEHYLRTAAGRRRVDRGIWLGLGRLPRWRVELPTIVIEFLSKGKRAWLRDYDEKRAEFMALPIQEYWLIDRFKRHMTVYRPDGSVAVVDYREAYRTPLMPGFKLPLRKIIDLANELDQ